MRIIIKTITLGLFLVIPALAMNPQCKSIFERMEEENRNRRDAITIVCARGAIGPDLDNTDRNPYVTYGNSGIRWKQVGIGANYGGTCKNKSCKAKDDYVYIPVGKIEYLIDNGEYCVPPKCPECNGAVEVRDWGFSQCSFQITGDKTNGHRATRPWCRADEYYYNISMDDLGDAEYDVVKILYLGPKDIFPERERL